TLGLKFRKTEFFDKANPDRFFFKADSLVIRPNLWSFLQGKPKVCFDGVTYGGALNGCFRLTQNSLKAPIAGSVELKDISVGEYDNIPGMIGRHIKGRLGGTITYSGQYNSLMGGTGEADLRLSEGLIELLQPILMLESIDFNELLIKLILKNQKINLTHVELKGPNMRGTLSGVVSLKKEFLKSSLNLRGTIEPFADFFKSLLGTRDTVKFFKQRLKRGRLSFIIHGTLTEPRIKFI
ncbi:MAG: type II secretion system protein GspN, partial [Desulfatiglandales bacterium]